RQAARPLAQRRTAAEIADAERPLRALAAHRHFTDADFADGGDLRLPRAALAARDPPAFDGAGAGHRRGDLRPQFLSAGPELRHADANRPRAHEHRYRVHAEGAVAAAAAEAFFLDC